MLTLQDLFDMLAYGELSRLAVGNSTLGTIVEADHPKIVSHINLGLTELHKRFNLKQRDLKLHQVTGVNTYYLRSTYAAVTEYVDDTTYIEHTVEEPFTDDLLKVLSIKTPDGTELPINDSTKNNWVSIPLFDTLIFSNISVPEIVTVHYQADHPKIVVENSFNAKNIDLFIPNYILDPLLLFIAGRIVRGMNTSPAEGSTQPVNTFMYQYELACKKLETLGIMTDDNTTRLIFDTRGFV